MYYCGADNKQLKAMLVLPINRPVTVRYYCEDHNGNNCEVTITTTSDYLECIAATVGSEKLKCNSDTVAVRPTTISIDTNKAIADTSVVYLPNGKEATYIAPYVWDRDNEVTAKIILLLIDGVKVPTYNHSFRAIVYR